MASGTWPADERTINAFNDRVRRLADLKGMLCRDVVARLMEKRAYREHESTPMGGLSQAQAEACVALMDVWIRQEQDRKGTTMERRSGGASGDER